MTPYRMAGNASFSLGEPRVTHETPTATQIGECVCNGCGSRSGRSDPGKNGAVPVADSEPIFVGNR